MPNDACLMEDEDQLNKIAEEQYAYHEMLMEYVIFENGQYYFNENKAINDGLSDFDDATARDLVYLKNNEIEHGEKAVFDDSKEFEEQIIQPYAWHRYGNYCGFGNSGGEPINAVDRTCMVHDNCYETNGWGSCGCDLQLIGAMGQHAKNSNLSWSQRTFAQAAAAHFAGRYAVGACT